MKFDRDTLQRVISDPAYAKVLAQRLIDTGESVAVCARRGHYLTAKQIEAVSAIVAGPGADETITLNSWCTLPPRHRGPHHRILRYLGGDQVVWVRWLGHLSEVVALSDCTRSSHPDFACSLFAGHLDACPIPRNV
ncbi:hypothetical protein ACIQNU_42960 [Streptomyces sp. NPDC091292]|uniref:hypothetical protein n=1 Tax=Streptomyces sp. NPDC091292 TaxID=3365991 RepID=UPI003800190C